MTPSSVLEGYLDRMQLAEQIGVGLRTISRYEAELNGLPSVKIGGRKMYRAEAVRDWILSRERQRNPMPSRQRRAG